MLLGILDCQFSLKVFCSGFQGTLSLGNPGLIVFKVFQVFRDNCYQIFQMNLFYLLQFFFGIKV